MRSEKCGRRTGGARGMARACLVGAAALAWLLAAAPAAQALVLLADDFNDDFLDPTKWTVNTSIPQGGASVVETGGVVVITARGHLITLNQYDPTSVGGVRITGTWTFQTLNGADFFQVLTRSDGVPGGSWGETNSGIEFYLQSDWTQPTIRARNADHSVGSVVRVGSLSISQGDTLEFGIIDDGNNNLLVSFREPGNSSGAMATAVLTGDTSSTDFIVFHNRESGRVSILDDVFVRNMAPGPLPYPTAQLSLADMVKGGDGLGSGMPGCALDPRNGSVIAGDPGGLNQPNNTNSYHPVTAYSFVDGVFIPDGGAPGGLVTLNSAGDTFGGFPDTDSNSWDYIEGMVNQGSGSVLGGVDYDSAGHTMIGMHANKGITFDLDAIRAAYPDYAIDAFTCMVGVADQATSGVADFWVFIDDLLVASQTGIAGGSGAFPLNIPIPADGRFLTLVATDAGNSYSYDQIIFGDPRLLLGYVPEPATLGVLGIGLMALARRRRRRA